jgi:hypothetical protein
MQHKEQQGFVSFAFNTDDVNYLELAYLQALNIKATQKINSYCLFVDTLTQELVTDKHRRVFDYIITVGAGVWGNPYEAEPYVFELTPFKETIKLESDLLFTRSIDHWWTAFRLKDVCLSTGAKNYQGILSAVRKYRELFDANSLPDVYNGLMYFRYSETAKRFFDCAYHVFANWERIKLELAHVDGPATTDVVYAITALMLGDEEVSMPSMDFLNFVHMKSGIQGWSDARSWVDTVMNERDGDIIRINNLNQYDPVHYYDKNYCTRELIEYYEQQILERSNKFNQLAT